MCSRITKIRGIRVCGRSIYRTDTGLKVGFRGPTVDVDQFLADLSLPLAQAIRDAVAAIDTHHARLSLNVLGDLPDTLALPEPDDVRPA